MSVTGRSSRWNEATLAPTHWGAVDQAGPSRPGQRAQSRLGRDQLLGLGRQLPEVRFEGAPLVGGEGRLAAGYPSGPRSVAVSQEISSAMRTPGHDAS